nr:MAG TPA: hypothetical protein [Caudoviricetes sp.]
MKKVNTFCLIFLRQNCSFSLKISKNLMHEN